MQCPKCRSENVRESRRSRFQDAFFRAADRQAYRCRECRNRFYAYDAGKKQHTHHFAGKAAKIRRRKLAAQVLIFAVMLAIFLLFLRYLTEEHEPKGESSVYSSSGLS